MYTLDNAEERAKEFETFQIPSLQERKNLKIGNSVKLIFLNSDEELPAERMWVIITKIILNGYEGTLDNNPAFNNELKYNDVIIFKYENIIDIND